MLPLIMVVDDDRDICELLRTALTQEGFQVRRAANGLRLISTLHVDRPDLILLDVMMSWIDGFDLCKSLKRNPMYQDIPIIFITGRTDEEDRLRGFECGAADYFTKPLDMQLLRSRVLELVGHLVNEEAS